MLLLVFHLDPLVSSNHATIDNGVLTDAGSTNGTYVNNAQLEAKRPYSLKV